MLDEYKKDREIQEENYDTVNLRSDILVSDRVLELLGNVNGKTILDIGCGNGKVARKLAQRGAKVFAIDVVSEQIEFAKKIEEEKNQGVSYFISGIEELSGIDFKVAKFDIVISLMTHLYLAEADFIDSFNVIAERLSSGGKFIYGNIHPARVLSYEKQNYFKSNLLESEFPALSGKIFKTQFYHHPMNIVVNSIVRAGLSVKNIYEPQPNDAEIEQYPTLLSIKEKLPLYLIIDCVNSK